MSFRPKTRAECVKGPRPCPWVSCRYSTFFDLPHSDGKRRLKVLAESSSLKLDELSDSWLESWQSTRYSCVLDIADEAFDSGESTDLSVIAEATGLETGSASVILRRAASKFRDALESFESVREDVPDGSPRDQGEKIHPHVIRRRAGA